MNFQKYTFKGSNYEIWLQHWELFRERIDKVISIYKKLFKEEDETVLQKAEFYKDKIEKETPNLAKEIQWIAKWSGQDVMWIYAINARSEIMNLKEKGFLNECTSFYLSKYWILAQNRDFLEDFESLFFVGKINNDNGNQILMLMEPGLVWKIWFNNFGIWVSLNFISSQINSVGLPVHLMLRKILECENIEQVNNFVLANQNWKSSSITSGDAYWNYFNYQFFDDKAYTTWQEEKFVVTNHFIDTEIHKDFPWLEEKQKEDKNLERSRQRYSQANKLISEYESFDIQICKDILQDKENGIYAICSPYQDKWFFGRTGSVTSLIMDLPNRKLHITPWNPNQYQEYYEFGL